MNSLKSAVIVLLCFAAVCCADLPYRTFRCRNGSYIDSQLMCDGRVDCIEPGDGLDENFGLCSSTQRQLCGPGTFMCPQRYSNTIEPCRNATERCNTISDCYRAGVDGDPTQDEINCGDEIQVENNCSLNKGKYLCEDGLRCLDTRNICDGFCNCFDCSDEKFGCTIGAESSRSLKQACFTTPNGPFCCSGNDSLCQKCSSDNTCSQKCAQFGNQEKCGCEEDYVRVAGTNNCVLPSNKDSVLEDIEEKSSHQACFNTQTGIECCSKYSSQCQKCDSDNICDQKCVKFGNQTGCFCDENYIGVAGTNNRKCFPRYDAAKEKLLVFLNRHPRAIIVINLFTKAKFTFKMKDISPIGDDLPYQITAANNYLYFQLPHPVYFKYLIYRFSLTSNETQEIVQTDQEPTCLAVDWITNNVYYSTTKSLVVCRSDGKICKTLKSNQIPYFISLAPRFGFMFWFSRVGESGTVYNLMKSAMDGSEEKLLLTVKGTCKMFTVDESTERIYWYNSTTEDIQSVNFDGENMMFKPFKTEKPDPTFDKPNRKMSVGTIFENQVFFADYHRFFIWSSENYSETFATQYPLPEQNLYKKDYYTSSLIENLHVYNPLLHRTKIANPCPESCKDLCLTRPSSTENTLNYTCTSNVSGGGGRTSVISTGVMLSVLLALWLV